MSPSSAVSYTHLDVYKRQMYNTDGTCDGVIVKIVSDFFRIESVSYTHLDVYKRQNIDLSKFGV